MMRPVSRIHDLIARFLGDRRANVAPLFALALIPIIGALGMAGEVSSWYTIDRSQQNASDAAAVAAATDGNTATDSGGVPMYKREAFAVAQSYGYVTGANNVTVTPSTVTCPSGSGTCYQVQISHSVPFYLLKVVKAGATQTITSTSIASAQGVAPPFCILALGGTGLSQDLVINGGPNSHMNGCSVASNGAADCHGHAIGGTDASYAIGPTDDCASNGNDKIINSPIADPYAYLAANIPANTCTPANAASSYPQEPSGPHGTPLPASNLIGGSPAWSGSTKVSCGDIQLTTGITTLGPGTVWVIENGMLDLNGNTLIINGGTIIFTGPTISGFAPSHFPAGGGTLQITDPISGTWAGMAIYQDPNLPSGSGVDISAAGNSPTWAINGNVYAPNSNVTISGAVGNNSSCIGLIVKTLTINGTGNIIDSGCTYSPITIPGFGGTRVALVQ